MKLLLLSILLSVTFGASAQARRPRFQNDINRNNGALSSITVDGLNRTYLVRLPQNYSPDRSFPLVLAFHGGSGNARSMENLTGLTSLGERENFIVVYPEALDGFWSDRREPRNLSGGQVNDVTFIDQLITTLQNTYNIDRARIYATGISNGGFMSQVLACDLSDRIAGIAPVASNLPVSLSQDCPAKRPVPVMYILGTEDPIVPYDGGEVRGRGDRRGQILSARESFNFWVRVNQINSTPRNVSFPDRVNDGTRVELLSAKDNNHAVGLVTILGGGHTWAGGLQYLPVGIIGITSQEINASQTIWRFFSNYSLP